MNTILITGGAGFIGTNLSRKLLKQGNKVIAIDNFITSTQKNIKELQDNPDFTFIKHDIVNPFPKFITSQLSSLTSVYHLACPTGVPNLLKLGEEMLLTCSIGTRNVLELTRFHNAKFLLTSSSEIYGDPEIFPQTEKYTGNVQPTGFRSTYEEGKRFAESLVALYVRKYKLDAKIVRIFNTYGPYMTLSDTRVIPNFINQIKHNKPLPVQGKGTQCRTFCHVDDLIEGFLTIMKKGTAGEAYNLGGEQEYSIKELAKIMIKLNNNPKITIAYTPRPEHDHKSRRPCLTKIKKLGWEQKISLEQGLKQVLQLYLLWK